MADVTINSITRDGDTITATGSGFTKTTTKFYDQDSNPLQFEVVSDSEAKLTVPEGTEQVFAVKGDVSTELVMIATGGRPGGPDDEPQEDEEEPEPDDGEEGDTDQSTTEESEEPKKTATPDHTPGDLTKDDDATTSNVSEEDLATAANVGAAEHPAPAPNTTPLEEGEHLPGEDFRYRVENTAAGDLDQDPREPYPTGNPPDPRESYYRIWGRYPDDEEAA